MSGPKVKLAQHFQLVRRIKTVSKDKYSLDTLARAIHPLMSPFKGATVYTVLYVSVQDAPTGANIKDAVPSF